MTQTDILIPFRRCRPHRTSFVFVIWHTFVTSQFDITLYPTEVLIRATEGSLWQDSVVLLNQINPMQGATDKTSWGTEGCHCGQRESGFADHLAAGEALKGSEHSCGSISHGSSHASIPLVPSPVAKSSTNLSLFSEASLKKALGGFIRMSDPS